MERWKKDEKESGTAGKFLACGRRSSTRRRYPGVRRRRSTITPSALCCGWFILYASRGTITKPRTIRAFISTALALLKNQRSRWSVAARRCVIARVPILHRRDVVGI